jgi:D-glycero-D-manno-heptose 1,7-bisphosphate phosphatase
VKRALFLDRDGVINEDRGYVHRVEDFRFIDGIFDTATTARQLGFELVVITNQAGIGRGLYGWPEYERLTDWMSAEFLRRGAGLAAVYACPYHADAMPRYRVANHPDRKPNPGMLLRAITELGLDAGRSLLIGDKESDIEAGIRAGIAATALFGQEADRAQTRADARVRDHREAQAWLWTMIGRHAAWTG